MKKLNWMMKLALSFVVAAALLPGAAFANTFTGQDVPASLLVVRGDSEWAWAAPCPPDGSACALGVVLELHHGFRNATTSDWTTYFLDRTDVFNAFHDGGQKCAAPYFNVYGDNCDSGDLSNGAVWNFPQDPAWDAFGFNNTSNLESFVLRNRDVPEPTTVLLLGAGLAALGLGRRRLG